MFINTPKNRFIFVSCFILVIFIINLFLFYPIFISNNIIISFALHPFNICDKYPNEWIFIKKIYIISLLFSTLIISNIIYSFIFKKSSHSLKQDYILDLDKENLSLKIGISTENIPIYLPIKGLFQNILVTGTIGSGKTSSAMYPFTEQIIKFNCSNKNKK